MPIVLKDEGRPPGPSEQVHPAPPVHHRPGEGLKGDWEWLRFAASLPAIPVTLPSLSANTLLYPGRCILTGLNVENQGAGSGVFNLRNGMDNTGEYIAILPLGATASASQQFGSLGVLLDIGLFAEIVSVTMRGAVFVIPLWHYGFTAPGT
jgi:hypothetical protein